MCGAALYDIVIMTAPFRAFLSSRSKALTLFLITKKKRNKANVVPHYNP
jgi:hypothetical protein